MASVVLALILLFAAFTAFGLYRFVTSFESDGRDELLLDLEMEAKELSELARQKARLLRDIRDLEFDFQTGHLSLEDYDSLRKPLERKTVATMKRLDVLRGDRDYDAVIDAGYAERFDVDPLDTPGSITPDALEAEGDDEDDALEARIAEATPEPVEAAAEAPVVAAAASPEDVEDAEDDPAGVEVEAVKAEKVNGVHKNGVAKVAEDAPTRPCPSCDYAMEADALFCSKCGTSLPRVCEVCETENDPDARFCKSCGGTMEDAAADAQVSTKEAAAAGGGS